jgi:GH25 family lysozyme M1 (1,4-beta-N-acetylmuramidase)
LSSPSNLDGINNVSMLQEVTRRVREIADPFIFAPNTEETMERIRQQVDTIMQRLQSTGRSPYYISGVDVARSTDSTGTYQITLNLPARSGNLCSEIMQPPSPKDNESAVHILPSMEEYY